MFNLLHEACREISRAFVFESHKRFLEGREEVEDDE
jgi:hypothetical protein